MHIPSHHVTVPAAVSAAAGSARVSRASASDSSSSSGDDSSSSTTSTAAITANDFLELLVTEMKNQDPTATTDPNEYINQLVQVNSLEQLIQINQDLGSATSSTSGTSSDSKVSNGASPGNLSPNTSSHSNIAAAAGHVATAMESTPSSPAEGRAGQISDRAPSNFLQAVGVQ
jgi:flagellar basal-body rod modification protein FlgD